TRVTMPSPVIVGIAQNSGADALLGTATYGDLILGPATRPVRIPSSAHPCPSGWGCMDVGNSSPPGDQLLSGGTWTLYGNGSNITGPGDRSHFVWQDMTGDGSMTLRITSLKSSSPATMAGLMLRQSTNADAPYYAVFVTPGNGVFVQYRTDNGQGTS